MDQNFGKKRGSLESALIMGAFDLDVSRANSWWGASAGARAGRGRSLCLGVVGQSLWGIAGASKLWFQFNRLNPEPVLTDKENGNKSFSSAQQGPEGTCFWYLPVCQCPSELERVSVLNPGIYSVSHWSSPAAKWLFSSSPPVAWKSGEQVLHHPLVVSHPGSCPPSCRPSFVRAIEEPLVVKSATFPTLLSQSPN